MLPCSPMRTFLPRRLFKSSASILRSCCPGGTGQQRYDCGLPWSSSNTSHHLRMLIPGWRGSHHCAPPFALSATVTAASLGLVSGPAGGRRCLLGYPWRKLGLATWSWTPSSTSCSFSPSGSRGWITHESSMRQWTSCQATCGS